MEIQKPFLELQKHNGYIYQVADNVCRISKLTLDARHKEIS
jgi:hypothetical protein